MPVGVCHSSQKDEQILKLLGWIYSTRPPFPDFPKPKRCHQVIRRTPQVFHSLCYYDEAGICESKYHYRVIKRGCQLYFFLADHKSSISWRKCSFSALIYELMLSLYISSTFDPSGSLSRTQKFKNCINTTFTAVTAHTLRTQWHMCLHKVRHV